MSTLNNIESITANQLARFILRDCVNPAFRAQVQSGKTGKPLTEDFPETALGQFYKNRKKNKVQVVSQALQIVREQLEEEDRRNMGEVYHTRQGATSDRSTSGLTDAFAKVNLNNGKQGDEVSELSLMDFTYTSNRKPKKGHRRRSNSLGTIDEVVECTRDSLRVFAESWSLISSSHLSEEIKDGIRDWMLNDMMSNQELSPELLEHVKQLVGGGVF
jgi:hypothetical protein